MTHFLIVLGVLAVPYTVITVVDMAMQRRRKANAARFDRYVTDKFERRVERKARSS